jgi:hypothetical protein
MQEIIEITFIEARKMVEDSGVILLLGWTLTIYIALDAIKKDPQASLFEGKIHNKVFELEFSPRLHTLVIFSMEPNTRNLEVVK